mgnify:CR=1 FL=1
MKGPIFPILATPEEVSKIAEVISVSGVHLMDRTYQLGTAYSDRIFGDQSYGTARSDIDSL